MKLNLFVVACAMSAVLAGCASTTTTPELSNKEKAILVLDNLGTTDQSSLKYISDETYIQHNQGAASGKQGLLNFLKQFPATPKSDHSNIIRAFEDRNYVVLHSDLADANAVVFDIFRFDNGLIVEHWDNFQDKTPANPSGHTQSDGTTKITDLDKTLENKILVKNMVEDVLLHGNIDNIGKYVDGEKYIQHNPWFGDGVTALKKGFAAMAAQGTTVRYDKIHAVLGEGNFVLVVSGGDFNGTPTSFYDLFRVDKGHVVEHWDILQSIPPKAQRMNDNGQFNFPSSAMMLH